MKMSIFTIVARRATHSFLPALALSTLLLTAQPQPAYSAEQLSINDVVKTCAAMKSRISRLTCYDELASRMGYVPEEQAAREGEILDKYGFWEVTKRRNAAGEEVIYLKNDATEDVISRSGAARRPTLVIKCKSGNTDVYLDWKTQITPYRVGAKTFPIALQLGTDDKQVMDWELSTDGNALFTPDSVEFVKQMRKNDRLILQLTPPNDLAQTVVHDISGLNSVLGLLVAQCYN